MEAFSLFAVWHTFNVLQKMRWQNWVRRFQHRGPLLDYYRFSSSLPRATVRHYETTDFEACTQIYKDNETGRFPEGYLAHYQEHLYESRARILVIEEEGTVVGTGGISLSRFTDSLRMATLSFGLIRPDRQDRGLGTLLFCSRVAYLTAWRDWLVSMVSAGNGTEAFYQKLGFQHIGEEQDEFGELMQHYMAKVLGSDVARFHELLSSSDCTIELDFGEQLVEEDRREEFQSRIEENSRTTATEVRD